MHKRRTHTAVVFSISTPEIIKHIMACRIQSAQTEYYLISTGEESDGSVVATVPPNEYNPDTTVRILVHVLDLLMMAAWQILTIDPPVRGFPAVGVVQGQVPFLYVGYQRVG